MGHGTVLCSFWAEQNLAVAGTGGCQGGSKRAMLKVIIGVASFSIHVRTDAASASPQMSGIAQAQVTKGN